jgi:Ca2+-binding EF-hand superfamily protein
MKNQTESLTPTKKIESTKEDELKEAFDLFDVYQNGKIDIKETLSALSSLGYHEKNHSLFKVLQELDTPENEKFGVSYEKFVEHINKRINDVSTPESANQVFNMFIDDPTTETITLNNLRKICREINEPITDPNINDMIERSIANNIDLNFKEYYEYLNAKTA